MPSASEQSGHATDAMADRYYEMAESMNQRGAMELAVPFYRQAVALLLAERQSLQQQLQGGAATPSLTSGSDLDALHGLLEAAEVLTEKPKQAGSAAETERSAAKANQVELESQIAELAAELSAKTAPQVMAGLKALADRTQGQLPGSGLELLGKTQMLLGKHADALNSFEAALSREPQSLDLQINVGAARLTNGDLEGALTLLRGVWKAGLDQLEDRSCSALFRNLSSAESKGGRPLVALQLRRKWIAQFPDAVPVKRALQWAQQGLQSGDSGSTLEKEALQLLKHLKAVHSDNKEVIQALADGLEAAGEYREAALLYRELLR